MVVAHGTYGFHVRIDPVSFVEVSHKGTKPVLIKSKIPEVAEL